MACRYTYQGKTYEAWEFDDVLRAMSPIEASKYMTGVEPVKEPVDLSGKQIMWYRANTRTDDKLGDGLFLEEVQSQRGSEGRTKGFLPKKINIIKELPSGYTVERVELSEYDQSQLKKINVNHDHYYIVKNDSGIAINSKPKFWSKEDAVNDAIEMLNKRSNIGVHPAPFIADSNNKATSAYITLLLKKAVSAAIDNGQSFVAWTTGDQQAERYNLRKTFSKIYVSEKQGNGKYKVLANDLNGNVIINSSYPESELSSAIGEDMAKKAISENGYTFTGNDLSKTPHWTQAMYGDEQGLNQQGKPSLITQAANDIARKMGGKVGTVELNTGKQPALIITPEMRAKVIGEGMPLFSVAPAKSTPAFRKWFAGSKMKANGEPIVFYHGRVNDFTVFDNDRLGTSTAHTTAALGHFFARDKGDSYGYGSKVHEVHLKVQKPYIVDSWNLDIQDADEAVKFREALQADGYDGIYIRDARYAVIFNSNQAKLTSNANPTEDNDIRFSQAYDDVLTGKKPLGWLAGFLSRNQLVELVEHELPEIDQYKKLAHDKDNFVSRRENKVAESYAQMRDSMDSDTLHQLGRVQGMATRLEDFDPAVDTALTDEQKAVASEYKALSEAAKKAYATMRDDYRKDLIEKRDTLAERIRSFNLDVRSTALAIAEIEAEFDRYIKNGVYFPLSRFGNYIVRGIAPDGSKVTGFRESLGDQMKLIKEMQQDGYKNITATLKEDYNREVMQGDAAKKIAALAYSAINQGVEDKEKAKAIDQFNQLLIEALPDTSYRKHFIHRKGTKGESTDALRAYSNVRTAAAKNIAGLMFDHKARKALSDADRSVNNSASANTNALRSVINELEKREETLSSMSISRVAQLFTTAGFFGALGFNVGSSVINMMQVASFTLPELTGKYGIARATAAIAKAYGMMFDPDTINKETGINIADNPNIDQTTKRALDELHDIGKINLTMTHDAVSQGQKPSYSKNPLTPIIKWAGYPFHVAEALNRQVTGMAAFELAYKEHGDFKRAVDYATNVIDDTQYDYGQGNTPRHMMGNTARVLTLFKKYALYTSWFIGRNASIALQKLPSEERLQARKTLATQMAITFATSGLFGLPIGAEAFALAGGIAGFRYGGANFAPVGSVLAIAAFQMFLAGLGADDEDELETGFRNYLADNFGVEPAEYLTKGIARSLPIGDIAGRTGLDQLWWRRPNKEMEGVDKYNQIANAFMGPLGGQVAGLFNASKMWQDGNHLRALEAALPAFGRNALAAYRFSNEGVNTIKGDKIVDRDLSANEIISKAIGFNPTVVAETYAANTAISKERDKRTMKKSHLINKYIGLDDDGRIELMAGDIADFNSEVSPAERITRKTIMDSIRARKSADKRTIHGLYLGKKQNYLRDIGRFANI